METIGTPGMWAVFFAIVLVMLAIDLFVVGGGKEHRVSVKEAATWSVVWVAVSLAFAGLLWWHLDGSLGREVANQKALEYLTGYLIEKSLAVDNVFVWLMLFSFFAIPAELQKRVLVLGVLGAIVLRTVMIFAGVWLIAQFHWLLYVFGAFLLITGIKMWWFADETPDLAKNPLVLWLRRHMKITDTLEGERFFVRRQEGGGWVRYATPLFLVLVFVGLKMLLVEFYKIPVAWSLAVIGLLVGGSAVASLLLPRKAATPPSGLPEGGVS